MHAPIGQAGFGNPLRQRLDQPHVAGGDNGPHPVRQLLIVHHAPHLIPTDRLA